MKRDHYGKLRHWFKIHPPGFKPQGLGYLLGGRSSDGATVRTSWVLRHNEKTGSVMTLHARYSLGEPRKPSPYMRRKAAA